MSVNDNHIVKKQCNIGKYEAYHGNKDNFIAKNVLDDQSYRLGANLRQSNISHNPLVGNNKLKKYGKYSVSNVKQKKFVSKNLFDLDNSEANCFEIENSEKSHKSNYDRHFHREMSQKPSCVAERSSASIDENNDMPFVFSHSLLNHGVESSLQFPDCVQSLPMHTSSPNFELRQDDNFTDLDVLPHKLISQTSSVSTSSSSKYSTANNESESLLNLLQLKHVQQSPTFSNSNDVTIEDLLMSDLNCTTDCSQSTNLFTKATENFFQEYQCDSENAGFHDSTKLKFNSKFLSVDDTEPASVSKNHFDKLPSSPKKVQFDLTVHETNSSEVLRPISQDSSVQSSSPSTSTPFMKCYPGADLLHESTFEKSLTNVTTSNGPLHLSELLVSAKSSLNIPSSCDESDESFFCTNSNSSDLVECNSSASKNTITDIIVVDVNMDEEDEEDEEDILHSSLNNLSGDSSNLFSLGTSLRLLKLNRILHEMNEKEREQMMALYRCFHKWRKNTRLSCILHLQHMHKIKQADTHYMKQLVSHHFYSWRNFIHVEKNLADAFYKKHMLAKGLSALKWLVTESNERNQNLVIQKQRKNLNFVFNFWKKRSSFQRRKRKIKYFVRWKKQYFYQMIINIYKEKFSNQITIKYYVEWRKQFETRQRLKLARALYNEHLKKNCLEMWILYAADCNVRRSQEQIAGLQYQNKLIGWTFDQWKNTLVNMMVAKRHVEKKILREKLTEWKRNAYYLKIRHNKQHRTCLALRDKIRVRRCWSRWKLQLTCTQLIKMKRRDVMRSTFLIWSSEKNKKIFFETLIASYRTKLVKRQCLNRWKTNISEKRYRRRKASMLLEQVKLRRYLTAWLEATRYERNIRELASKFRRFNDQILCRNLFHKWNFKHYRIISDRDAEKKRKEELSRQAVMHWMKFARRRKREKNCNLLTTRITLSIQKRYLRTWETSYGGKLTRWKKVELHYSRTTNQKCRLIIREWHKLTEESLSLKPFIRKRQHRIRIKVFDAWMSIIVKRRHRTLSSNQITNTRTRNLFHIWFHRMVMVKRTKEMNEINEKKFFVHVIVAWKKVAKRRVEMRQMCIAMRRRTAVKCLRHWSRRTQQRQLAFEKELIKAEEERVLITQYFKCWFNKVSREMALQREVASSFKRSRDDRIKKVLFESWMKSFFNMKKARRFESFSRQQFAAILFSHWKIITQNNLEKETLLFTSSMKLASSSSDDLSASSHLFSIPSDHEHLVSPGHSIALRSPEILARDEDTEFSSSSSYPSIVSSSMDSYLSEPLSIDQLRTESESSSMSSEESGIVTQRRADSFLQDLQQGSKSLQDNTDSESDDPTPASIQRTNPIFLLPQDENRSRIEMMIRFILHRISSPLLSIAFHQWKLKVYYSRQKKTRTAHAQYHMKKWSLKNHFLKWRREMVHSSLARKCFTEKVKRTAFKQWKLRTDKQNMLQRLKAEVIKRRDDSSMKQCFYLWLSQYKKKATLNDILDYWKRYSSSPPTDHQLAAQRHRDAELLHQCWMLWQRRMLQVKNSKIFHLHCLWRRTLRHWHKAAEEESRKREELSSIRDLLMKKRFIRLWRRRLYIEEGVTRLRSQVLKSWLINMLARWRSHAKGAHYRRDTLQAFIDDSNRKKMSSVIFMWREKTELYRSARLFRQKLVMTSYFSSLRHQVTQRKMRLNKFMERKQQKDERMRSTYFELWKRISALNLMMKDHVTKKKRNMFILWSRKKNVNLAMRKGCHVTQRWFFILWRNRFVERSRRRDISRDVLHRWQAFVVRHRNLNDLLHGFITSQSHHKHHCIINKWSLLTKQLLNARNHHKQVLTARIIKAWSVWSYDRRRRREKLSHVLLLRDTRIILSSFERWQSHLHLIVQQRVNAEAFTRTRLRRRERSVLMLWRIRASVERIRRCRERRLLAECFSHWSCQTKWRTLMTNQLDRHFVASQKRLVSVTFETWKIALCHNYKARSHFNISQKERFFARWIQWNHMKRITKEKLNDVMERKRKSLIEKCFAHWGNRLKQVEELSFLADEYQCKTQFNITKKYWMLWYKQKQARHNVLHKTVMKWRSFTRRRVQRRLADNQRIGKLLGNTLLVWRSRFKVKTFIYRRDYYVIERLFRNWLLQTSYLQFADQYHQKQTLQRSWLQWRLHHTLLNINKNIDGEIKSSLLNTTFQAWKLQVLRNNQNKTRPKSRIPRLTR